MMHDGYCDEEKLNILSSPEWDQLETRVFKALVLKTSHFMLGVFVRLTGRHTPQKEGEGHHYKDLQSRVSQISFQARMGI